MKRIVEVLQGDEVAAINRRWSASSPLRIGTVCSGTDAPILAVENLLSALNDGGRRIEINHVFSCERVAFKREFIVGTTDPPLLFKDLTELASGRGECHDGFTRDVPSDFHVLVAGTECVDFSSLSTSPKGLKGGGRSDVTFWATHKLVEKFSPAIVILENVLKCPAKEMVHAFEEIGYIAAHTKVCTSDYLLPQSRARTYFVFLHASKARFLPPLTECDWIDTMKRLGPKRRTQEKDRNMRWTVVLDGNARRKCVVKKKGGHSKPLSESLNSKWLQEIRAIEKREGLIPYDAEGGRPYSDATKDVEAIASLPDRAKMRLDVQCKRATKAGIDPFEVPLLWNPAQQLRFTDPGVSNGTPRATAPCVTPGHEWIVSSRRGPLTGAEALALQGIRVPEDVLSRFDDGQLRNLAGNAMSTNVVVAVFLATFRTTELICSRSFERKSTFAATVRGTKRARSGIR